MQANQTSNGTTTYFNGAVISATEEQGQDEGEARGASAWAAKFKELPKKKKKDSYFNAIFFYFLIKIDTKTSMHNKISKM